MMMSSIKCWVILLVLAVAMAIAVESQSTMTFDDPTTWGVTMMDAENNSDFDFQTEMLLDSETNHRLLAQRIKYISYEALRANNVPCVRSGASYYTCLPRKRINPYRRGCSRITNCYRYY
ncbi:hypothetical protein Tsubulata_009329 [Turnera subulata]|uniref:Rapid ALkalinization Factor n=1 Tax=Turnera subulata TaxID=218843 RepID=A0A9Q0GGK4_9ROSI|nr:hypothetical protein Tsubulata_009329 [Turnera subulata]